MNKEVERIAKHLYEFDPFSQAVLNGQLLIEEKLTRIISSFVHHPELLEDARLSFYSRVCIARSMSLDEQNSSIWDLILAINSLRNELAHQLESSKLSSKVENLRRLYQNENPSSPQVDDHALITGAVAMCLGFLNSFQKEIGRFRKHLEAMDKAVNPHRHKKSYK